MYGITDYNDITNDGWYYGDTNRTNHPGSAGYFCVLCVYNLSGLIVQDCMVVPTYDRFFRYRYHDVWESWIIYSYNIPSFYKNYSSLDELKIALGL